MTYYMAYCLVCGDHSDPDIGTDDVYEWQDAHEAEEHAGTRAWFYRIEDGEEHRIMSRPEIGGFKVGDSIVVADAEWVANGQTFPQTITGFAIYGYQGIVATTEQGAHYLDQMDHAEVDNTPEKV